MGSFWSRVSAAPQDSHSRRELSRYSTIDYDEERNTLHFVSRPQGAMWSKKGKDWWVIVNSLFTYFDLCSDISVLISLKKSGHLGMAGTLLVVIWTPGVIVWAFLHTHGVQQRYGFIFAITGLSPAAELVQWLCNGEKSKGMFWYRATEGVIEAPLSFIVTAYGIMTDAMPDQFVGTVSLALSLLSSATALVSLDFYGYDLLKVETDCITLFWSKVQKLPRFFHRLVEVSCRVLSLTVLAAALGRAGVDSQNLVHVENLLVVVVLLSEFVLNFQLLRLTSPRLAAPARSFVSTMMVVASPPLFLPSARRVAPAYAWNRVALTALMSCFVACLSLWYPRFASQTASLVQRWPWVFFTTFGFVFAQLVSMPFRSEFGQDRSGSSSSDSQDLSAQLAAAIVTKDVVLLNVLIGDGGDLDGLDLDGNSALHLAISNFDETLAMEVLSRCTSVARLNKSGDTPLSLAVKNRDSHAGSWLLFHKKLDALANYPFCCQIPLTKKHHHGSQYNGIALGRNGKLYCAPANAGDVLAIDPVAMKVAELHDDALRPLGWKCFGLAAATDGNLYGAPDCAPHIVVIDPTSERISFWKDERFKLSAGYYSGISCGRDGKLYCSPVNADHVLIIDPSSEELTFWKDDGLKDDGLKARRRKYGGICIASDGKFYCPPLEAKDIMVIDPSSKTIDYWSDPMLNSDGQKYRGIAAGTDGKLYCAPAGAKDVLVIDPPSKKLKFLTIHGLKPGEKKFQGIASGSDGKMYCAPCGAAEVLVIDQRSEGLELLSHDCLMEAGSKYSSITHGRDGKLYCAPDSASNVLVIDPVAIAQRTTLESIAAEMDFGVMAEKMNSWLTSIS